MKVFAIALLFAASAVYAQTELKVLGFTLPEGKDRVTIPIEIHNNLIVMPVVLNGQLPLKFILDTGVRTSILTEKSYSDILGLPYSRQLTIMGPGEQHFITAYIANNVSIFIPPGIQGNGHALLVLEKDYLELRNFLGAEVHGVLGYELFSRFVVLINYQDRFIEIIDPKAFKVKRKFQALDISVEDTKPFLKVPVSLPTKKTLKLLVDTGASHGLMLDPESDNDIQVPEKNVATVIGRALGGEITGKIGRVQALELGKYSLSRLIANYPDPNSYMDTLRSSSVVRNGSIGGEVLSRFTVVFHYSAEKIYIQKNSSYKKEFQNNLSGITLKAKGARLKTFEIIEVRAKSVADRAEIKKGDILINLNGSPIEGYNLNEINGVFNSKAGKKVLLLLDREGEKIRKTITLEEEI
jgi:Aspartyl protease/PDZ domain